MLCVEVVETGVGIEFVQASNEVVDVHAVPALLEVRRPAQELNLPLVNVEVDGHAHHGIVTDALVVVQPLVIGDDGMALVWGEPCFRVCGVLSGHVHVILSQVGCSRQDAHQFDGFGHFGLDLCRCRDAQQGKQAGDE